MGAIITNVSSVNSFIRETANQYSQILSLAQAALSHMGEMTVFVEGEKEKLEKQMIRLAELEETLSDKKKALREGIDNASASRDYYADKYYRTDDRDDAAYYQRRLEEAATTCDTLTESYETAVQIQKEAEQKKQQFQMLFKAISAMTEALKKNDQEVKKYISVLGDEMTYNRQALSLTFSSLQSYISSPRIVGFGAGASANGSAYSSSSFAAVSPSGSAPIDEIEPAKETKRKTREYRAKLYKIKSGSFGYNSDGTRPVYRVYHAYSVPVRNMLYDTMKGMHTNFREAVMKQLGGVMFLNAKHGFNYSRDCRGRMIHIIGVDVSDPDFSRQLLLHVGHHLYEMDKSDQKLAIDRNLSKEIARNMKSSNQNIQKIANGFRFNKVGSGSKFFAQCFRAYVTEDHAFLAAVKSNFGESYRSFAEIIARLPNK